MHDPVPDPTALYRVRDGVYAPDLLIAAVVEFDVFTWLAEHGPVATAELREVMGWAERPADVLLTLGAAHDLVVRDLEQDRVAIGPTAHHHLTAGSPYDLRAYYGSLAERPAVREFCEVLRTDAPADWASAGSTPTGAGDWSGRLDDAAFARRITAAMDARGSYLAPALSRVVADVPVRRLLDVGGSSGTYGAAVLDGRPAARAAVFERPPVDAAARALLVERGHSERIDVITGDMFRDALPAGFDVHLYSQVLHDWDRLSVEYLLAASYAALEPGGWLLDHDTHIDRGKTGPRAAAEYSALLVHSTPGKCWSVGELAEAATRAGFVDVEHRPTVADRGVLVARKP